MPTVTEITGRALRIAADILSEKPEGLARRALWPLVLEADPELEPQWAEAVEEYPTSLLEGVSRAATNLVKAGWLRRPRQYGWRLTGLGRDALDEFKSPAGFYGEATRAYRYWEARQEVFNAAGQFLSLLPEESWASLSDLAELFELKEVRLAGWLQTERPDGWHRALSREGEIPAGAYSMQQEDRDEWRELLQQDGLFSEAISSADRIRAKPEARLELSKLSKLNELGRQLDTEAAQESGLAPRRSWLVRGSEEGTGASLIRSMWRTNNICSLRTFGLPRLSPGSAPARVRAAVKASFPSADQNRQDSLTRQFHAFLSSMAEGDIVLCNDASKVYLGVVKGPARWPSHEDEHAVPSWVQRPVDWQNLDEPLRYRVDLPETLINRLDDPSVDLIDLTEFTRDLERLLSEEPRRPGTADEQAALPDVTGELAADLMTDGAWLQECVELLRDRPQMIFYGPPGTGKTHIAQGLADHLTGGRPENTQLVQFHPAYSYEDFFEGYRPRLVRGSADRSSAKTEASEPSAAGLAFDLVRGPLRRLADAARQHPAQVYVLIIDEINRGNLSKVFGELYFLLEYRKKAVRLLYGSEEGSSFDLPSNLVILGTMNTSDRSIALMDSAMRRRFFFQELHPDAPPTNTLLEKWLESKDLPQDSARILRELNGAIAESPSADRDFRIGPSYLMREAVHESPKGLERVWRTQILPLLAEYHWGDRTDISATYGLDVLRQRLGLPTMQVDPIGPLESDEDANAGQIG
ncbi:McrB family protein [Kitasatospora sp. NPDC006697]|uniref:McrB family protein n=1 Tax=Kitasatospora sp. NPDC006697 TaxID=3364020 RepID=UPI0036982822